MVGRGRKERDGGGRCERLQAVLPASPVKERRRTAGGCLLAQSVVAELRRYRRRQSIPWSHRLCPLRLTALSQPGEAPSTPTLNITKQCETERIQEHNASAQRSVSLSQFHCVQLTTCSPHPIARSSAQLFQPRSRWHCLQAGNRNLHLASLHAPFRYMLGCSADAFSSLEARRSCVSLPHEELSSSGGPMNIEGEPFGAAGSGSHSPLHAGAGQQASSMAIDFFDTRRLPHYSVWQSFSRLLTAKYLGVPAFLLLSNIWRNTNAVTRLRLTDVAAFCKDTFISTINSTSTKSVRDNNVLPQLLGKAQ